LSELPEWAACLVFLVVVLFFAIVVESEGDEGKREGIKGGREGGRRKGGRKEEGSVGLKASKRGSRASRFQGSCRYVCLLLLSSVRE
jgi:hypothetical protein